MRDVTCPSPSPAIKRGILFPLLISVAALVAFGGCSGAKKPGAGSETASSTTRDSASKDGADTSSAKSADSGAKESATTGEEKPASDAKAPAGDVWSQLASARRGLKSYRVTMEFGGRKMVSSMKLSNGEPIRVKSEAPGGGWALLQWDKKVQYVRPPQGGPVVKMEIKPSKGERDERPQDLPMNRMKSPKTKISDATVEGVACWKFATPEQTFWVDKRYGLVRQISAKDRTIKVAYAAINAVPDKEFELPAGTQVKDMADMAREMEKRMKEFQRQNKGKVPPPSPQAPAPPPSGSAPVPGSAPSSPLGLTPPPNPPGN